MRRKQRTLVMLALVVLGLAAVLIAGLASSTFLLGQLLRGTAGSLDTPSVTDFAGWSEQGTAHLHWDTESENGLLGFNLYRSPTDSGPYEPLTSEPIPNTGSEDAGASYDYSDLEVAEGETYYYKLEPVDSSGGIADYGPVSVTVFPISSLPPVQRIFLPTVLADH
jgi:hypothetical protein